MSTCRLSQALEESEHLTVGHQLNMRPELPIMSCVLLGPPSHEVQHAQQQSIIKKMWYIRYEVHAGDNDCKPEYLIS